MKNEKILEGVIEKSDLEGGSFTLRTSVGHHYRLEQLPTELQHEGTLVSLEGSLQEATFGIGFGMPTFLVSSAKRLG